VSRATFALALCAVVACNDVGEFRGTWQGPRVGSDPVLSVGFAPDARATLSIGHIDTHGFQGSLTVAGLVQDAPLLSIQAAEADVLAGMTWSGSPLRVYLAFFDVPAGGGTALAMIALYDDRRVELRVLRGGATPLYGIFALAESP
jgi:hypothetical protein